MKKTLLYGLLVIALFMSVFWLVSEVNTGFNLDYLVCHKIDAVSTYC